MMARPQEARMRTWQRSVVCLLVTGAAFGCTGTRVSAPPPLSGPLTIDRLMQFKHPSQPTWSPDARRLAFVWDLGGVQNVWVMDMASTPPSPPRQLTTFDEGPVDNLFWSRDGGSLWFVRDGDLWRIAPGGGPASAVWTTPLLENQVVPSPDGTRVAFVRGGGAGLPDWQRTEGDLWVRSLADGRETRLTRDIGVVSGPTWSPDGLHLAFAFSRVTPHADAPSYSGGKILYTRVDHGASTPGFVSAAGGAVTTLPSSPGWDASPQWLDAARLLVHRVAEDNRTRELLLADVPSGRTRLLYREVDPVFWSLGFVAPDPSVSPDGRYAAFVSDRDGWDHLYIVPTAGGEARQVTRGRYEVRHLAWSPDSRSLAFDRSVEDRPGVRHLAIATIEGDLAGVRVAELTSGRGTNVEAVWAPDSRRLVYQHTDPRNSADLYVTETPSAEGSIQRLTDSMPEGVDRSAFVEPQLVHYRAPDGQQVPAYLFVPKGLDLKTKHPAVVWIHGDGINQNYDGWHVERNYAVYYSFHQYLLQHGYVVLAPEYRGSIGLGRAWRQSVYYDVGGKDAEDAAASADYLKTLGYVDAERIGVWGLSYGGFFTLIAMADHPTAFRCGIDVAGSVDYRMWYEDPGGAWVVARMGTPTEQPAVYEKAAVIDRVTHITRPLLVLHGTADGNVPYIESVRLIDVLLKAGKEVDFMMYPGEFHYFHRKHVLRDAWTRAAAFFDRHLQPAAVAGGR
jgi:dipeptidyl aminopeptidase/acylaminoacyl peptidase